MRGSHVSECPLDQALQSTLVILTKVRPGDLAAPTPCASWDVRALVSHFVGTARYWAAAIAGEDAAADADYAAGDFVAAYEESIRIAVAAFAAEGALDKTVRLPFGEFPGAVLRDLAAMEQFTHGWDLARAIGTDDQLAPELVVEVWTGMSPIAGFIGKSGFFGLGPSGEVGEDAPLQSRLLDLSGRRP